MAKIFITGSSDGLGLMTARELMRLGHTVVLHARSEERSGETMKQLEKDCLILTGDLGSMKETIALAESANESGHFDAVIHNAGINPTREGESHDGLPLIFTVNSLAPYILTCLMHTPRRLIYLSSDMHIGGDGTLNNLPRAASKFNSRITYSDTKLHNIILAKAVSRRWENVYANAVHPGWVSTKMGGKRAPDSLQKGIETQVWLATSGEPEAKVSGAYFYHKSRERYHHSADDVEIQEKFLQRCGELSGVHCDK